MELAALTSFLLMGFVLGMVHAFDPDHLAAVGGLSASDNEDATVSSPFGSFRFAVHWSLGHGSALLFISLSVFLLGSAIPVSLSEFAERSVAYVLIAIGVFAFWKLFVKRQSNKSRSRPVGAPLVGLLHGTAGSAPLLALIPVSQLTQPILGVVYVLFFSAGVVISMMTISGLFSHSLRALQRSAIPLQALIQGVMATFSLMLGLYLAFYAA